MNIFPKLSAKIWILVLVVVVSIVLILLAFTAQPQQIVNPPTPPPSTDNGLILEEPFSPFDFPYVGVKSDDTIAVFNELGEEIVIGLVHNKWTIPKWSPERTHIAVLGRVGFDNEDVADLFVYELATNEWTRGSFYISATDDPPGITGFEWASNNQIVYSQGQVPDNWIHTYDVANQEIRKAFRVPGSLEHYNPNSDRYLVKVPRQDQETDPTYQVLNKTGSAIQLFNSEALPPNYNIQRIIPGRSDNEFVVHAISGDGEETFIWDFAKSEYKLLERVITVDTENVEGEQVTGLDLRYICNPNGNLFYAVSANILTPDSFSILVTNPELVSTKIVTVINPGRKWQIDRVRSYCNGDNLILNTFLEEKRTWWVYNEAEVKELEIARNFTDISN